MPALFVFAWADGCGVLQSNLDDFVVWEVIGAKRDVPVASDEPLLAEKPAVYRYQRMGIFAIVFSNKQYT